MKLHDKGIIKKTFPIKMKEDVGMSKPKKHVNKVRWDPKLNNHFRITLHKYNFLYMLRCCNNVS